MNIQFGGKRALVTGAGKGIGRAIAKALAEAGATTFALSRTLEDLHSLQEDVPQIRIVHVDLRDWDETKEKVEALGQVDLLVNNAALIVPESFFDTTPQTFQDVIDTNVKGVINVSQIIGRHMVELGRGGSIVNISSQVSLAAMVGFTSYSVSKAALDSITRILATELGPSQVRVNSVNPTIVLTKKMKHLIENNSTVDQLRKRIPQGKFAREADVVNPVLFLLSDKADMINGVTLPIDGGFLAC